MGLMQWLREACSSILSSRRKSARSTLTQKKYPSDSISTNGVYSLILTTARWQRGRHDLWCRDETLADDVYNAYLQWTYANRNKKVSSDEVIDKIVFLFNDKLPKYKRENEPKWEPY